MTSLSEAASGIRGLDEITGGGLPRGRPALVCGGAGCGKTVPLRKLLAQRYVLRLYVTGTTPRSVRAIERIKAVCEKHLAGRYDLEVIDLYQRPSLARDEQIIATPTLIRKLPPPLRRFVGHLFEAEKILFGADLLALRRRTAS